MKTAQFKKLVLVSAVSAMLAACGGGGGGSTPSGIPAVTPAPAPVTCLAPQVNQNGVCVTPATPIVPVSQSSCDVSMTGSTGLILGDYALVNNTWGADSPNYVKVSSPSQYTECIGGTSTVGVVNGATVQTGITANWNWNMPSPGVPGSAAYGGVMAYPEIKYWPNHTPMTPMQINNLRNLTINYDYSSSVAVPNTYTWNVLIDMWVSTSPNPTYYPANASAGRTTEIGINLQMTWSDQTPIADTATIDGYQWTVKTIPSTTVPGVMAIVGFVPTGVGPSPLNKASLHMKPFYDYIIAKGWVPATSYLTSVEFGTETVKGTGALNLNSYSVSFN